MGNKPKRLNMDAIKEKPHQIISSEESLKDVEPYMGIYFQCEDCGEIAEPNKQKSNNNWNSYDVKCVRCGGKVKPQLGTPPKGWE